MPFTVRPFALDDYPAFLEVRNAVFPDYAVSVEEARHWDENLGPKCLFKRTVALRDGTIVGAGEFRQIPWTYDPHGFRLEITVHLSERGRGAGSAIFEHLILAMRPHEPRVLRTMTRATDEAGARFLLKRGFVREQSNWESRIDLTAFDPSPYAGLEETLAREGIRLRTLRELRAENGWQRKLHALFWAAEQGMPDEEAHNQIEFETFDALLCNDPFLVDDAFIVAAHGGDFIGLSYVRESRKNLDATTGLTGVIPEWRGRKIALAMKVRSLATAKALGFPSSKTWNDTRNGAMLAVNVRLGFVRNVEWVQYVKNLEPEESP